MCRYRRCPTRVAAVSIPVVFFSFGIVHLNRKLITLTHLIFTSSALIIILISHYFFFSLRYPPGRSGGSVTCAGGKCRSRSYLRGPRPARTPGDRISRFWQLRGPTGVKRLRSTRLLQPLPRRGVRSKADRAGSE